jgi:cell division septation protein DedD
MQQNFPPKHKSQLIKSSNDANIKAKRRLIGSIAMLLIALVVLLNVTSRVKPIPITPQIITFKTKTNNDPASSNQANMNHASNANTATKITNPTVEGTANTPQSVVTVADTQTQSPTDASDEDTSEDQSDNNTPTKVFLKPRIVNSSITTRPTPDEILNGNAEPITVPRFYVQIATSTDRDAMQQLKQNLMNQDIKTSLQQIDTPDGLVFRLRTGPFETKDAANNSLSDVTDVLKTE